MGKHQYANEFERRKEEKRKKEAKYKGIFLTVLFSGAALLVLIITLWDAMV